MADRERLPLPKPTWLMPVGMAGKWAVPGAWNAAQMHAYSDAENAALRAEVERLREALRELAYAADDDSAERFNDAIRDARVILAARKGAT